MEGTDEKELPKKFGEAIQNKKLIVSCMEAVPSALAWTFTTLLLVNRTYGRGAIALTCMAACAFEIFIKTQFYVASYQEMIEMYTNLWPS